MIGSYVDKTGIASDVVNTIRIGTGYFGVGEVVTLHELRLFRGEPLLAGIMVVSDDLLFLAISGSPHH